MRGLRFPLHLQHAAILVFIGPIIFLPNLGLGFIHDDFVHFHSAAFDSIETGLTRSTGGTFYAPLTWLTYRLDFVLWGLSPFASALVNLTVHLANVLLVYFLVRFAWGSDSAAFWAAIGFSLLLPSTVWAVMWIATRAHLLTTLFYISAIFSCLRWARLGGGKSLGATIAFAAAALFSKEIGITVVPAIVLILFVERKAWSARRNGSIGAVAIVALTAAASIFFLWMRSRSGAIPVSFGGTAWYSYSLSWSVFGANLRAYTWRTYGLLFIFGIAAFIAARMKGEKMHLRAIDTREVLTWFLIFLGTVAPVILLAGRSGIYTYLPGAIAAITFGGLIARWTYRSETPSKTGIKEHLPAALLIAIFGGFVFGQSIRWVKLAETSESILIDLKRQLPKPASNSLIILEHSERDTANLFPDNFDSWGFEPAVRLTYDKPTLSGKIIKQGEPYDAQRAIRFEYVVLDGTPGIRLRSGKVETPER